MGFCETECCEEATALCSIDMQLESREPAAAGAILRATDRGCAEDDCCRPGVWGCRGRVDEYWEAWRVLDLPPLLTPLVLVPLPLVGAEVKSVAQEV